MREWEHQTVYGSGEIESTRTGYRWRLKGEVEISLLLAAAPISRVGRFEMVYVINHPTLARQLPGLVDRERAIEQTKKGETHIDCPFWIGHSPEELEEYCNEHMLPLPQDFKEHWLAYEEENARRAEEFELSKDSLD